VPWTDPKMGISASDPMHFRNPGRNRLKDSAMDAYTPSPGTR